MHLAYTLGLGVNRSIHGDKKDWVNHMMDYLENKTIYRKYKDLKIIFSNFEITHRDKFFRVLFYGQKFYKICLKNTFKKILIYSYKKYVSMDFELKKLI